MFFFNYCLKWSRSELKFGKSKGRILFRFSGTNKFSTELSLSMWGFFFRKKYCIIFSFLSTKVWNYFDTCVGAVFRWKYSHVCVWGRTPVCISVVLTRQGWHAWCNVARSLANCQYRVQQPNTTRDISYPLVSRTGQPCSLFDLVREGFRKIIAC